MRQIKFQNPVFRTGLNFTVRDGTKWRDVEINEFVEVEGWNGYGRIVKVYVTSMGDIPQEVLTHEHDNACHTWEGLAKVMVQTYPHWEGLGGEEIENQVVTCIGFYLYKFYV